MSDFTPTHVWRLTSAGHKFEDGVDRQGMLCVVDRNRPALGRFSCATFADGFTGDVPHQGLRNLGTPGAEKLVKKQSPKGITEE